MDEEAIKKRLAELRGEIPLLGDELHNMANQVRTFGAATAASIDDMGITAFMDTLSKVAKTSTDMWNRLKAGSVEASSRIQSSLKSIRDEISSLGELADRRLGHSYPEVSHGGHGVRLFQ